MRCYLYVIKLVWKESLNFIGINYVRWGLSETNAVFYKAQVVVKLFHDDTKWNTDSQEKFAIFN